MSRRNAVKFLCSASLLIALSALGGKTIYAQWEIQRPPPPPTDFEVLTRGPVHEAFAETVVYDTEEDVVVLKPPPEPLDEVPPTEALDAPNVAWIPGYWAWDDDRDDYLWVSGIWRVVPPGRQYVSGFWSRSGHGFDWTSGFWADADDNDIQYLPEPPPSAESGPPGPPPSPDHIWVPGTWLWMDGRYVWRPGSWTVANPNWSWVPAHYVTGPHGAVFVEGYWDYPVERRGILFAPVYVTAVARGPRFVFTPSIVIDTTVFTDHLFVRPRYHHYYFGDYYEASYTARGIIPWFAVETNRIAYDPIFEHRRWMHRDDRDWGRRVETDFHFRREHVEARPPRTLSVQINIGGQPQAVDRRLVIARPLAQLAVHAEAPIRLRTVAPAEREVIVQRSIEVKKAREQRKVVEEKELADKGGERARVTAPVRVKLPPTTVAAKKDTAAAKDAPPPKKPEIAKADTTVQPKPKPTTAKKPPELVAPTPTKKEAESTKPQVKPAENQPPPAKKPVEPPPPAAKKSVEPPPAAKKPPEQSPPPAKKPGEPPPQAKKESPDKSKDKDKDNEDDDDKPDSPKGKPKKKDKKDDDK